MQGGWAANAHIPKLPTELQAWVFKGKFMSEGCRLWDQLVHTVQIGQRWANGIMSGILVTSLLAAAFWDRLLWPACGLPDGFWVPVKHLKTTCVKSLSVSFKRKTKGPTLISVYWVCFILFIYVYWVHFTLLLQPPLSWIPNCLSASNWEIWASLWFVHEKSERLLQAGLPVQCPHQTYTGRLC